MSDMTTIKKKNDGDDPLIAEIEKMIADNEWKAQASFEDHNSVDEAIFDRVVCELQDVRKLVIADRVRQQAEKEKMIAELENKIHQTSELQLDFTPDMQKRMDTYINGLLEALDIIQGKQEEVRKE